MRGRPIGGNMLRICELVETAGPIAPFEIAGVSGLRHNMVRSYVCRAAHRGMLIREGRKYTAAKDWREVAGLVALVEPPRALPANSVFQMGDMALVETHRRVLL